MKALLPLVALCFSLPSYAGQAGKCPTINGHFAKGEEKLQLQTETKGEVKSLQLVGIDLGSPLSVLAEARVFDGTKQEVKEDGEVWGYLTGHCKGNAFHVAVEETVDGEKGQEFGFQFSTNKKGNLVLVVRNVEGKEEKSVYTKEKR